MNPNPLSLVGVGAPVLNATVAVGVGVVAAVPPEAARRCAGLEVHHVLAALVDPAETLVEEPSLERDVLRPRGSALVQGGDDVLDAVDEFPVRDAQHRCQPLILQKAFLYSFRTEP